MPREQAEAADRVMGLLQTEEERLAGLERAKGITARRLPEVHVFERLTRRKGREPVEVGIADEAPHDEHLPRGSSSSYAVRTRGSSTVTSCGRSTVTVSQTT